MFYFKSKIAIQTDLKRYCIRALIFKMRILLKRWFLKTFDSFNVTYKHNYFKKVLILLQFSIWRIDLFLAFGPHMVVLRPSLVLSSEITSGSAQGSAMCKPRSQLAVLALQPLNSARLRCFHLPMIYSNCFSCENSRNFFYIKIAIFCMFYISRFDFII